MTVAVFDDAPLYPLTHSRAGYSLVLGCFSLIERIQHYYTGTLTLYCPDYLSAITSQMYPDASVNWLGDTHKVLFLNSRFILDDKAVDTLAGYSSDHAYAIVSPEGDVLAIHATPKITLKLHDTILKQDFQGLLPLCQSHCTVYNYTDGLIMRTPWDYTRHHERQLHRDMKHYNFGIIKSDIDTLAYIKNDDAVFIDTGVIIEPFVFINTDAGPVYIEKNVVIKSHTRLEGPLYIGQNTQLLGGYIQSSRIGRFCKLKGDISHSIIHDYTNKAHEGFIGHSYIGDWVNLGAGTTVSNLKTTYGLIRPETATGRHRPIDQFLGACIGDHVKTAIGTCLNAGTSVGYGATLLGAPPHHGYIPAFRWGESGQYQSQRVHDFITAVSRMMARRNISFRATDKKLVALLFEKLEKLEKLC